MIWNTKTKAHESTVISIVSWKRLKRKKKASYKRQRVWEKMRKYDNRQVMEIQSEDDKTIR